ncbi:hypothetical protein D3C76_1335190 [compost metagenome]
MPGGNALALIVDQPGKDFVVQHQLRVLTGHHRLKIQGEPPLIQRQIKQIVPGMMVLTDTGQGAPIQADPARIGPALRLRQCLIRQPEYCLRCIAMNKGRQPDRGDRGHVGGAGRMQAGQGGVQLLRQLQRLFAHQAWRQHGKFAAAYARDEVVRSWISGAFTG